MSQKVDLQICLPDNNNTMWQLIGVALVALLVVYLAQTYLAFQKNLAAAKASGLPYIVSPIYAFNPVWLLTHSLFLPIINMLEANENHPAFIEYVSVDWFVRYD